MSPKMRAFSAQASTVRGLITVERSPFMNAARVRSATVTMRLTVLRPSGVSYSGYFASTMSCSASCAR